MTVIPLGYMDSNGQAVTTVFQGVLFACMEYADNDGSDYQEMWIDDTQYLTDDAVVCMFSGVHGDSVFQVGYQGTLYETDSGIDSIYLAPWHEPLKVKCTSTNCRGCTVVKDSDGNPHDCSACNAEPDQEGTCTKLVESRGGFFDRLFDIAEAMAIGVTVAFNVGKLR